MTKRPKPQPDRPKPCPPDLPDFLAQKRKGFTLVELLVVMAIISILAAVLLPAVSRAVKTARATGCTSNLRQLATACQMYVDDWKGYLPPGNWNNLGAQCWDMKILNYIFPGSSMTAWNTCDLDDPGVFKCPSDNYTRAGFVKKSYSGNSGKRYNGTVGYGPPRRLSVVAPQPSTVLLLVENWGNYSATPQMTDTNNCMGINWGSIFMYDADNDGIAITPCRSPFHLGRETYSFCDLHVKTMTFEETVEPNDTWTWYTND